MSSIDWSVVPRERAIRQLGGRVPWFNGGWPVRAIAIEPRGRFFVTQGERGLRLFHAATGELVRTLSPRAGGVSPERVGFSADGEAVFARIGGFHERKSLCAWDVESGAVLREIEAPAGADTEHGVDAVAAIHAESLRAITVNSHTVTSWDFSTGTVLRRLVQERAAFGPAAFLGPEGHRAVIARGTGGALLWDVRTGDVGWTKNVGPARSIAGAPDGSWFATGDGHGVVHVFDAAHGLSKFDLGTPTEKPYGNDVSGLAVSADGRRLAMIFASQVRLWEPGTGRAWVDEKLPHQFYQAAIAIDPRGEWVLCAASDGTMARLGADGSRVSAPDGKAAHGSASEAAFGAAGAFTVSATPAWLPRLAGCIADEEQRQDRSASAPVIGPALAANVMQDGELLVWDLASSDEPLQRIEAGLSPHVSFPSRVRAVAFHPDGRRIAIATDRHDATVQVWDARAGKPLLVCEGHEADATTVAFSADGSLLVSESDDRTARVWAIR